MSSGALGDLVASRTTTAVGMGGLVLAAKIGLGLDDHSGDAISVLTRHDQQLPQQLPSDEKSIFPSKEIRRQFRSHGLPLVKGTRLAS